MFYEIVIDPNEVSYLCENKLYNINGQVAFMSGKLKHKGDMSLLMRLPGLFGI